MEFDYESERCYDCDGHFRHFPGCDFYEGEPFTTVQQRVAIETMVREVMQ